MKKRFILYLLWVLGAASLWFFENNAGTRIVLLTTLLPPFLPALRGALLSEDREAMAPGHSGLSPAPSLKTAASDEPGDVRDYMPGDPLNRIHWKLSARRDELLVREWEEEPELQEHPERQRPDTGPERNTRKVQPWLPPLLIIVISLLLLFLLPSCRLGAQALLNRVFDASERLNAYVYDHFPVDPSQDTLGAMFLLSIALIALLSLVVLCGSRALATGLAFGAIALQIYFGLSFSPWIHILLFAGYMLFFFRRPLKRRQVLSFLSLLLALVLLVFLLYPGVNAAVEEASERIRDRLTEPAGSVEGARQESEGGENETRHVHTQSLIVGEGEAVPDREYSLVSVEQEQISLPHWTNYLRIALLLLLTAIVVILPFLPFVYLNRRRRIAEEHIALFQSEDIPEAVCAIFRSVTGFLEETGCGGGNLPCVRWPEAFPEDMPEGYAGRFQACAALFEEAAYSGHGMTEEQRAQMLELLEETQSWLLPKCTWKQKLSLRYKRCIY